MEYEKLTNDNGQKKMKETQFIDIREVTNYHLGYKKDHSKLKEFMTTVINQSGWPKREMNQEVKEMMKLEIKSSDYRELRHFVTAEMEQYELNVKDETSHIIDLNNLKKKLQETKREIDELHTTGKILNSDQENYFEEFTEEIK